MVIVTAADTATAAAATALHILRCLGESLLRSREISALQILAQTLEIRIQRRLT